MPMEVGGPILALRCSTCGKLVTGKPIMVKTCCANKPWTFCSQNCYEIWKRNWIKQQEQISQGKRGAFKL